MTMPASHSRRVSLTPVVPLEPIVSPLQGYISREQLMEIYGIKDHGTIRRWQSDGLPTHRVGIKPVYLASEVETWFRNRPPLIYRTQREKWEFDEDLRRIAVLYPDD